MMTSNPCTVIKVSTPDGTLYVTILEDQNGNPIEVRTEIGKSGSSIRVWTEAISVLITELLKNRVPLHKIMELLSNRTTDRVSYTYNNIPIRSGANGIGYALLKYLQDKYEQEEYDKPRYSRLL